MKFVLVAGFPDSILSFRGTFLNSLLKKGVCVHVVAPGLSSSSEVGRVLIEKGVLIHDVNMSRTGVNPFADIRTFFHLIFILKKVKPDFILSYTIKPVIYGSLAALFARVPRRFALITGLGYAFQEKERNFLKSIVRRLYSFSLRKVDKVFFQNPDDKELFFSSGIISKSKPFCILNGSGVDIDYFAFNPVRHEKFCFLLIARLLGDKGVREYAAAAKIIKYVHPNVDFGLVGWLDGGPDSIKKSELDAWIAEGHIDFHGRINDVREIIGKSSVYVLPSYREGTPRTVLEAMAIGRPIITTDAPGCKETVIHGKNGFLVPVKSVDALCKAMLIFINNEPLLNSMGIESREIAVRKYDVHKVNDVMLKEMCIT